MEILVIDDNAQFANALWHRILTVNEQKYQSILINSANSNQDAFVNQQDLLYALSESKNTFTLSDKIIGLLPLDSILFININLAVGIEKRQYNKGIELLTWLRIKGIMNHCVLYSFQSLDTIAKADKQNLILFSKGLTFIQLPNNFSNINVNELKYNKAEKENLKTYLKSSFNISEFRHRDANWWGVKALWDVHKVASEGKFDEDYPDYVKERISELNNTVGIFLHGLEVQYINQFVEELRKSRKVLITNLNEELLNVLESSNTIKKDHDEWKEYEAELRQEVKYRQIEQLYTKDNLASAQLIRKILSDINTVSEETREKSAEFEASLIRIETLKSNIEESEMVLASFDSEVRNQLFSPNCLHNSNVCNILLIDDNADNGWKSIFKKMFPSAAVSTIIPDTEFKCNIDDLYNEQVKNEIDSLNNEALPLLILLDLRLFDEIERSIDIENVSGKLLMKKIREDFKGIPILVTTASNKVWTFQKLINLGADAYWVKEGIDELRDASDSVRNYCKLQFLVDRMTDGRYQVLKKLTEYAEKFKLNKSNHWSIAVTWNNREVSNGDTESISRILNNSTLVLKNYLHNYYLGFGNMDQANEVFIVSSLINKLCGIFELIHPGISPKDTRTELWHRQDYFAESLRNVRNHYSHAWFDTHIADSWLILTRAIEILIEYLDRKDAPKNVSAAPISY